MATIADTPPERTCPVCGTSDSHGGEGQLVLKNESETRPHLPVVWFVCCGYLWLHSLRILRKTHA